MAGDAKTNKKNAPKRTILQSIMHHMSSDSNTRPTGAGDRRDKRLRQAEKKSVGRKKKEK